jgi:hypothetical protein
MAVDDDVVEAQGTGSPASGVPSDALADAP